MISDKFAVAAMCSITESVLEPELTRLRLTERGAVRCKKCQTEDCVVLLRGKDAYCKSCLILGVQHKMRATLGKHKATRPGDRILVGVSGGENSIALLHLLKQGIESDHKKLLFVPVVVWIDEGAVLDLDIEQRRKNAAEMREILESYGFSYHFARLEDYISGEVVLCDGQADLQCDESQSRALHATLSSLRDCTARQELVVQVRRTVLLGAARLLGCLKIMTAETSSRLAVELLSGVAGGVGAGLPHRVGFRDSRDTVNILRPMRELSGKEVYLYCTYHHLRTWHGQEPGPSDTIRRVTQEFLFGLQVNFPSTIPTVNRTGDKLTVAEAASGEDNCCLCEASLDTETVQHNALQATLYSSLISAGGSQTQSPGDTAGDQSGCCGEGDGSCQSRSCSLTMEEVQQSLCYTCRRIFERVKSVENIPASLREKIKAHVRRRDMRQEISDFLL